MVPSIRRYGVVAVVLAGVLTAGCVSPDSTQPGPTETGGDAPEPPLPGRYAIHIVLDPQWAEDEYFGKGIQVRPGNNTTIVYQASWDEDLAGQEVTLAWYLHPKVPALEVTAPDGLRLDGRAAAALNVSLSLADDAGETAEARLSLSVPDFEPPIRVQSVTVQYGPDT